MKNAKKKQLLGIKSLLTFVLIFMTTFVVAQTKNVTGVVIDELGDPLIGVTVSIQGTTMGTITDLDGAFSIQAKSGDVLVITMIGYADQTVKVDNQTHVSITLKEDTQLLEEVVVVGYGVVKKSDVTGALSRLSSKQIEDRPVQNALQAMQGKVTGVDITSNNRPGELGAIRVRGNRSMTATNEPLYVIDGIPMVAATIADINPGDIESMEILKDASSTAIYGSRGANGVILVTTKKGQEGKTTVSYEGSFTFSNIHSLTDYMNAGQLLDYNRNAAITGGSYNGKYGTAPDPGRDRSLWLGDFSYMDASVASAYRLNADKTPILRDATEAEKAMGYADRVPIYDASRLPSTDWADLATRTAFTQNHQVSLSAGSKTSKLYMSFAYLDQEVPMKDQDFNRFTVNLNGEIAPTKWLTVGMGLNGSHSIKNYGIVSNFSNTVAKDSYGLARNLMPWAPAYDENGDVLITNSGDAEHNILRNIGAAKNEYRYYGVNLSSYADITILPWLKWRTNFGTQFRNSREGSFYGENFTNPLGYESTAPGVAYNAHAQALSWTLENLIYINKKFGENHSLGVTLLQSAEKSRNEGLYLRAYEVVYPSSLWYSMQHSNNSKYGPGSNFRTLTLASYMGRINYSFMDRYLLTLTGRSDGSSVLAEGNKWDFFPSAAFAWRMEQEEFIKKINWVNQLKLRVGYGVTGNSAVNPFQTGGSVTSQYANIPFGPGNVGQNTVGTKTDLMPNPALKWERTASTNLGLDFSVLRNRISGSIELYKTKTTDLLMNKSLPIMTGYARVLTNVGKTENKGLEISLSTINVQTDDFSWETDWSFSTNSEKITGLADGHSRDTNGNWFVGSPINVFWDYKYDRMWQDTPEDRKLMALYKASSNLTFLPGQYKIVDQPLVEVAEGTEGSITKEITVDGEKVKVTYMDNGFGKYNDDDKSIYKKSPDWSGGINNSFTYKDWTFSFFTYFRFGNYYYGLTQTMGRRIENDTWSKENTGAKFAQPTTATRTSSYDYVRNYTKGNMAMVKNIALSYSVPKAFLNKYGIGKAQVYAQVLNPFIWGGELVDVGINPDDITGWDASNHIGGQTNNTAITRSFVLGVRLGF